MEFHFVSLVRFPIERAEFHFINVGGPLQIFARQHMKTFWLLVVLVQGKKEVHSAANGLHNLPDRLGTRLYHIFSQPHFEAQDSSSFACTVQR
jgi:hypothetical protein